MKNINFSVKIEYFSKVKMFFEVISDLYEILYNNNVIDESYDKNYCNLRDKFY